MSQNFETFSTPYKGLFLVFGVPNAKYLAFGTPDENALRFRIVRMFIGLVGFYS